MLHEVRYKPWTSYSKVQVPISANLKPRLMVTRPRYKSFEYFVVNSVTSGNATSNLGEICLKALAPRPRASCCGFVAIRALYSAMLVHESVTRPEGCEVRFRDGNVHVRKTTGHGSTRYFTMRCVPEKDIAHANGMALYLKSHVAKSGDYRCSHCTTYTVKSNKNLGTHIYLAAPWSMGTSAHTFYLSSLRPSDR